MNRKIDEASMIITHGDTATFIKVIEKRKKTIAVPRLEQFGEHMNNHQIRKSYTTL